jgi:hypothetical protein
MIELVAFTGPEGVNNVFSHVSLILVATFFVFLQIRYSLISSRLSRLHGNPISRHPIFCTIGIPS